MGAGDELALDRCTGFLGSGLAAAGLGLGCVLGQDKHPVGARAGGRRGARTDGRAVVMAAADRADGQQRPEQHGQRQDHQRKDPRGRRSAGQRSTISINHPLPAHPSAVSAAAARNSSPDDVRASARLRDRGLVALAHADEVAEPEADQRPRDRLHRADDRRVVAPRDAEPVDDQAEDDRADDREDEGADDPAPEAIGHPDGEVPQREAHHDPSEHGH